MPELSSLEPQTIRAYFKEHGFVVLRSEFTEQELRSLQLVLERFHSLWLESNTDLYNAGAVNSAYLTDRKILSRNDRLVLLRLLGDRRIVQIVKAVFPGLAAFMNTQLFFNPRNPGQKNYWHRDVQYSGMTLEQQAQALTTANVIHLRLALMPERGLELVPGTHKRWDTALEQDVRLAQSGRAVHDALPNTRCVELARGDLLIFSANMIHRGLYGKERFAFDMLFCDPTPELLAFVNPDCLPDSEELAMLECPDVFLAAQKGLSQ